MSTPARGLDAGADDGLEQALLVYAQQKAARWGAERFAAEFRRRDEAEEKRPVWTSEAFSAPVEASVEAQVVEGEPSAFRPEPPRVGFDPTFVVSPDEPLVEEPQPEALPEPESGLEELEAIVEEPEPVVEEAEPAQEGPEPEPAPIRVPVPSFEPDAAWSAGSGPSGVRGRLPTALRHPHVPRPPAPDPAPGVRPKRRWRDRGGQLEPAGARVISGAEWARMSPGARRLYGYEDPPETRRAG